MAVYYKHIKGCAPSSNLNNGAWTYISWGSTTDVTKTEAMPKLRISKGKSDDGTTGSLGYFLTSSMPTPTIANKWIFSKGFEIKSGSITLPNDCDLTTDGQRLILHSHASAPAVFDADVVQSWTQIIDGSMSVGNILSVETNATTTSSTTAINNNGITTKGYCEAEFFNAKSDKRAKENIQLIKFSALDVIKQLPVYSFNYKNKTETIPGILAQDLLELGLPVELVNNTNASGENDDYMTIKESKLIYILLKAIQEQQAEIEELKKQINN